MLPGLSSIGGTGVRKTAAVSYQTETFDITNTDTYTFSSQPFGSASSDRIVIVSVLGYGGSASTISSVTIGGVSATIIRQQSTGTTTLGIAAAAVPTGTTGNVVAVFSATKGDCAIAVWSGTGQITAAGVASGSNTDLSEITLASEVGGFVVAVCMNINNRTTTWTGATENFDDNFGESEWHSGASLTTEFSAVSVQPTLSDTSTTTVLVAATF